MIFEASHLKSRIFVAWFPLGMLFSNPLQYLQCTMTIRIHICSWDMTMNCYYCMTVMIYNLQADLHDELLYDSWWLNVLQRNSHIWSYTSSGAQVVIPLTCPFSIKDARSLSLGMTTIAIPSLLLGAAWRLLVCSINTAHIWKHSSTKLKQSAKK